MLSFEHVYTSIRYLIKKRGGGGSSLSLPPASPCLQHSKLLARSRAPLTLANRGAEVVTFTAASLQMRAKDTKLCVCVPCCSHWVGCVCQKTRLNGPLWVLGHWIMVCCRLELRTLTLVHFVLWLILSLGECRRHVGVSCIFHISILFFQSGWLCGRFFRGIGEKHTGLTGTFSKLGSVLHRNPNQLPWQSAHMVWQQRFAVRSLM